MGGLVGCEGGHEVVSFLHADMKVLFNFLFFFNQSFYAIGALLPFKVYMEFELLVLFH